MDKEMKKKLRQAYKEEQRQCFIASLPMDQSLFEQLFDYLDAKLNENACNNDLTFTKIFLQDKDIEEEPVIHWLKEQGGYCDCEVLGNVEEKFQPDAIF